MNVFVIGGAGFIGSHICRKFVKSGHQVTVFGPPLEAELLADINQDIHRVDGDVLDPPSLFKGLLDSKADVVIHLAAYGVGKDGVAKSAQHSPKKALDVNVTGFYHVVEAAAIAGVSKLLWSSSTTVFGPAESYPDKYLKENAAVSPTTFYGSTKVMNELMTRYYRKERNLDIAGIRLPLVYGPGRWYKGAAGSLVDIFEGATTGNKVVVKAGPELFDLMYIKDVADVFYHLAVTDQPLSETYHVKSHTTSFHEIVEVVRALMPESRLQVETAASPMVYPLVDVSHVEQQMGYTPCHSSVQDACQDYLNELQGGKK
jgi:nucleoside-diphosphate-sugar epimerase